MLISILDLGSNSFHWLVAETDGHSVYTRYQRKRHVRLASSMQGGALNAEGLARALEAVGELSATVPSGFREAPVLAVATGAIRQASNGGVLLRAIEQASGIRVELIDGNREARLAYLGALSDRRCLDALGESGEPKAQLLQIHAVTRFPAQRGASTPEHPTRSGDEAWPGVRTAVVDLGGGSLELAVGRGLDVQRAFSVPRGLLTAVEHAALETVTLEAAALETAAQWVVDGLVRQVPREAVEGARWIAGCGIARELRALMERLALASPGGAIDVAVLEAAWPRWAQWGSARLRQLGVSPERVATLPLGAAILASLCRRFGAERLAVAEGGLRQGLALERHRAATARRLGSPERGRLFEAEAPNGSVAVQ